MKPVFFAWTRSFWAAASTAILVWSEVDDATAYSLGSFIGGLVGADPAVWGEWFTNIPPVLMLLIAIQQRSGAARPYTINPRAEGAFE